MLCFTAACLSPVYFGLAFWTKYLSIYPTHTHTCHIVTRGGNNKSILISNNFSGPRSSIAQYVSSCGVCCISTWNEVHCISRPGCVNVLICLVVQCLQEYLRLISVAPVCTSAAASATKTPPHASPKSRVRCNASYLRASLPVDRRSLPSKEPQQACACPRVRSYSLARVCN